MPVSMRFGVRSPRYRRRARSVWLRFRSLGIFARGDNQVAFEDDAEREAHRIAVRCGNDRLSIDPIGARLSRTFIGSLFFCLRTEPLAALSDSDGGETGGGM